MVNQCGRIVILAIFGRVEYRVEVAQLGLELLIPVGKRLVMPVCH